MNHERLQTVAALIVVWPSRRKQGLQGATNFTFTAQGASDPAGGQLTYTYHFGDGSNGSGNPASHAYNTAGTFNVRLTVTNPRSLTTTASTTVTVKSMSGV